MLLWKSEVLLIWITLVGKKTNCKNQNQTTGLNAPLSSDKGERLMMQELWGFIQVVGMVDSSVAGHLSL